MCPSVTKENCLKWCFIIVKLMYKNKLKKLTLLCTLSPKNLSFFPPKILACLFVVDVVLSDPLLVLCGYATAPSTHRGKRKNLEEPSCPQPAKAPHLNTANAFRSTECLLLSLIRKESFDETDSPMKEVFASKIKTQFAGSRARPTGRQLNRFPRRSCSLERILDESADSCQKWELFRSAESLASLRTTSTSSSSSGGSSPADMNPKPGCSTSTLCNTSPSETCPSTDTSQNNSSSSSHLSTECQPTIQRTARPRPRSIGNCLDILEHREISSSCFSINAPIAEITMRPDLSSSTVSLRAPGLVCLHGSCLDVSTGQNNRRRCNSSLDLCKPVVASRPSVSSVARRLSPEQSKACVCVSIA